MDELVSAEHHKSVQGHMNTEDIVFGYCTEFMVRFEQKRLENIHFMKKSFRNDLVNLVILY